MAEADQFVRILFQVLEDHHCNHPPHFLVGSTATLTFGKPGCQVHHTMIANLGHRNSIYLLLRHKSINMVCQLFNSSTIGFQ